MKTNHFPRQGPTGDGKIRLEDAAEILDEPIDGGHRRNQVVRKGLGNGGRIEVRRFYLFDPRGLEMQLFERDGDRPFMKARAFSPERFHRVVDWFTYLSERPEAMRSETRLTKVVEEFSRMRGGDYGPSL